MSIREESRSDSLSLQFKLASFQAQLEAFVDQETQSQDEISTLQASLSKMRELIVEKDELLQRLNDADDEQFKRAVARADVLAKEKAKIQELYAQSQQRAKELAAQREAYKAIKEVKPDLSFSKHTQNPSSSGKVEKSMIDAMAKEQLRIQLRLEKLESTQQELLDVAKTAQSNHLALSIKLTSIQSEAKRAAETLSKAVASLCVERKKSKDLEAKLHVAQTQLETQRSQIAYLQEQLAKNE